MKIGNKIKCINARESQSLKLGAEYEIVAINPHGNLGLLEKAGNKLLQHFYKPNRFELTILDSGQIDLDKTYKTRDGRKVSHLLRVNNIEEPICGVITDEDGQEWPASWKENGAWVSSGESGTDLIEEKQNRHMFGPEVYVNHRTKLVGLSGASSRTLTFDEILEIAAEIGK